MWHETSCLESSWWGFRPICQDSEQWSLVQQSQPCAWIYSNVKSLMILLDSNISCLLNTFCRCNLVHHIASTVMTSFVGAAWVNENAYHMTLTLHLHSNLSLDLHLKVAYRLPGSRILRSRVQYYSNKYLTIEPHLNFNWIATFDIRVQDWRSAGMTAARCGSGRRRTTARL